MEDIQWLKERVKELVRWDGCYLNVKIDEAIINSFFGEEGHVPEEGKSLAIKDSTNRLIMCNRFAKKRGILPYKTTEPHAKVIDPCIETICTSKKDPAKTGKREKGQDDDGFREIKQKKDKIKSILAEYDPKVAEMEELKGDQVTLDLCHALAERKNRFGSSSVSDKLLLSLIIQEISTFFKSYFNTNIEVGFGHSSLVAAFVCGKLSFEESYFSPAFAAEWSETAPALKEELITSYFKRVAQVTDLLDLQGVGEKTLAELNGKNINNPWDIFLNLDLLYKEEGFGFKFISYVCNFYGVDKKEAPGLIEEHKKLQKQQRQTSKEVKERMKSLIQKMKPIFPDWQERKRPIKIRENIESIDKYRPTKLEFEMLCLIYERVKPRPDKKEQEMIKTLKTIDKSKPEEQASAKRAQANLDLLATLQTADLSSPGQARTSNPGTAGQEMAGALVCKSKPEVRAKKSSAPPKEKFAVKTNPRMIIVHTRMTRGAIPDPKRAAEHLAKLLSQNLQSEKVVSRMLKVSAKLQLEGSPTYHSFIKIPDKQASNDPQPLLEVVLRDNLFARSDAGTGLLELKLSALKLVDQMSYQRLLAKEAAKELNALIVRKKRRRTGEKRAPRTITATETALYRLFDIGRRIDTAKSHEQKVCHEDEMLRSLADLDLTEVTRPEHIEALNKLCRRRLQLAFERPPWEDFYLLKKSLAPLELKSPVKPRLLTPEKDTPVKKSLQKDAPSNFTIDQFYRPKAFREDGLLQNEEAPEAAAARPFPKWPGEPGLGKVPPGPAREDGAELQSQFAPKKKLSGMSAKETSSTASTERPGMQITKEGNCSLI